MKSYKRYILTLCILQILTIILSLSALNRMCGGFAKQILCFDYPLRNSIEHLLSGFYIPLIIIFLCYISYFIISWKIQLMPKNKEIAIIIIVSIFYLIFEVWFQLSHYNSGSILQIIMSLLGIVLCWIYTFAVSIKEADAKKGEIKLKKIQLKTK